MRNIKKLFPKLDAGFLTNKSIQYLCGQENKGKTKQQEYKKSIDADIQKFVAIKDSIFIGKPWAGFEPAIVVIPRQCSS